VLLGIGLKSVDASDVPPRFAMIPLSTTALWAVATDGERLPHEGGRKPHKGGDHSPVSLETKGERPLARTLHSSAPGCKQRDRNDDNGNDRTDHFINT
jgi:hypothetical protein